MDSSGLNQPDFTPLPNTQKHAEFVCGWGAAFINITLTFPLNKVMFRQQLLGISCIRACKQIYLEGPQHLYRGLLPPLMQKSTSMAIMFGIYNRYHELLILHGPQMPTDVAKGTAAMLAGTTEAILVPFERIQTLMQDQTYHKRFQNTFEAFRKTRSYGLAEYYRGLSAILMRNGPSSALFFLGRDHVKERLPESHNVVKIALQDFISGAFLGAIISTFLFPLNAIKTRMQSEYGTRFISIIESYRILVAERNHSALSLMRGVHINYMRSFLSWGIINASYEILLSYFKKKS